MENESSSPTPRTRRSRSWHCHLCELGKTGSAHPFAFATSHGMCAVSICTKVALCVCFHVCLFAQFELLPHPHAPASAHVAPLVPSLGGAWQDGCAQDCCPLVGEQPPLHELVVVTVSQVRCVPDGVEHPRVPWPALHVDRLHVLILECRPLSARKHLVCTTDGSAHTSLTDQLLCALAQPEAQGHR